MRIFNELESEVRSYCRTFPTVFSKAQGSYLVNKEGKQYLDFFAGAGTLNYGHNNKEVKKAVIDYLTEDKPIHGLDMMTEAKQEFLETFQSHILKPRDLNFKVQFPGPTGTNAVESALKLARKVKGRSGIISFTNAFHGMTLGALSVTGNAMKRKGAGVETSDVTFMPYDSYHGENVCTASMLETYLEDDGSGFDAPAAIILETVQGEGGLNTASKEWLQKIEKICRKHDMLLIADDIQIGCGRSGTFFSFEDMGIQPDIVCLSKSISGLGFPFALVLMKPELDIWKPGEHNGTFRGFNPAFVAATQTLKTYWADDKFSKEVKEKSAFLTTELERIVKDAPMKCFRKGRGMMQGISFEKTELGNKMAQICFEKGLMVETSGIDDQVLKLLPPLTISKEDLQKGLSTIAKAIQES
jgi:diaminobutyrate-2-oxoglutarate transaminase